MSITKIKRELFLVPSLTNPNAQVPLNKHRDVCPAMRINIRYLLGTILGSYSDELMIKNMVMCLYVFTNCYRILPVISHGAPIFHPIKPIISRLEAYKYRGFIKLRVLFKYNLITIPDSF